MKLQFEFSGYFNDVVGKEWIEISVDRETLTLGEALDALLITHEHFRDGFEKNNILIDGVFKAMFVIDNTLANPDTIIQNEALIRVFPPICGG